MHSAHHPELPDQFELAELSDGQCHFRLHGRDSDPVVVLLHGATVPGWEFDRIVPHLNGAGFRTLCPDLFGHGYSARPNTRHDHALFQRQIDDLLNILGVESPVYLLGHSLGAAVAARFAVRHPERVAGIVLVAPLLDFLSTQPVIRILRVPLLGPLLVKHYLVPMLVRRRTRRYAAIDDGRFVRMFRDQLRMPGFDRSLLSLLRSGALGDQSDVYRILQESTIPCFVTRGSDDEIFQQEHFLALQGLLPRAAYHEFPGLEHPMLLTHPETVAPAICGHLSATMS